MSRQLLLPGIAAIDAATACSLPACAGASASLQVEDSGGGCTGNEKRKGRKATHASAAARRAAYLEKKARLDFVDKPEVIATLTDIANQLDCSKNELMQSLVRFALTNRNWRQVGLYGARRDGALQ